MKPSGEDKLDPAKPKDPTIRDTVKAGVDSEGKGLNEAKALTENSKKKRELDTVFEDPDSERLLNRERYKFGESGSDSLGVAKAKLDFSLFTPQKSFFKEEKSEYLKFKITDDQVNQKDMMISQFRKMDPWTRKQFLSEINQGKETVKTETLGREMEDEDDNYPRRRRQQNSKLNAKDLAALSSIIHSYAGEEDKYSVHDFFFAIEKLAKSQMLSIHNMLYIAQNKLKDKVLQFARKAKLLEIDDYHDFKRALVERFEITLDEKEARYRFFNAQMTNTDPSNQQILYQH